MRTLIIIALLFATDVRAEQFDLANIFRAQTETKSIYIPEQTITHRVVMPRAYDASTPAYAQWPDVHIIKERIPARVQTEVTRSAPVDVVPKSTWQKYN